jgi:trigger factor
MKTEFVEVSETRKNLTVEIPSGVVDAEIDRVAQDYGRAARVPGFRPGRVPARLVKQRFKDQILHDVAHKLIPPAVDEALKERGIEPVDTPDIQDVLVQEGKPLRFTATFETVPPIDPGDYEDIILRRQPAVLQAGAVEQALEELRQKAARYEPVEGRSIESGDSVVIDLERRPVVAGEVEPKPDRHENVTVEIGAAANPPGFDEELLGLEPGSEKGFTLAYPADYAISELAGTSVEYRVWIRAVRQRVVPELDDEFAKDVGDFDSLEQFRERVREDILKEARRLSERQLRVDLLKQLAEKVTFEVPESLVEREIDRRVEEFVRRLLEQGVDPRKARIDWDDFRKHQREMAAEAVRSALVLDAVARRENLTAEPEDVEREVTRHAERTGRSPSAVRAQLEKDGGLPRLLTGLRREKVAEFLLSRATIADG